MNLKTRTQKLLSLVNPVQMSEISDVKIDIIPFRFNQTKGNDDIMDLQYLIDKTDFCSNPDYQISENNSFNYWVFNPKGKSKSKKAILLLHGLNERTWDKYLTWAEELANADGTPVILFPIAFHMNRTPAEWHTPRWLMQWAVKRQSANKDLSSSTFCNVALSSRLSISPERFYISGRESIYNVWQLLEEIREGKHPLFSSCCDINFFAYSIGGFISQVMFPFNPDNLLSNSKLFIFCGGSLFEYMNGVAKDIMDEDAFGKVKDYYIGDFNGIKKDLMDEWFITMLMNQRRKTMRELFYTRAQDRVKILSLKADTVIPGYGAKICVGKRNQKIVEELDLPYNYSHQTPFPLNGRAEPQLVDENFNLIFDKAKSFLC